MRPARPFLAKSGWQRFKDYALFPALALVNAPRVALGNLVANGVRNLWTFSVVFCGHFPGGVQVFDEAETRGQWYLRQINGSANIEGETRFHLMTGYLSHPIKHHLFPDIPAARYPALAPPVRAICPAYEALRDQPLPAIVGQCRPEDRPAVAPGCIIFAGLIGSPLTRKTDEPSQLVGVKAQVRGTLLGLSNKNRSNKREATHMARPGAQTQAKRRREQVKREKREAKDQAKALRKELKARGELPEEPQPIPTSQMTW